MLLIMNTDLVAYIAVFTTMIDFCVSIDSVFATYSFLHIVTFSRISPLHFIFLLCLCHQQCRQMRYVFGLSICRVRLFNFICSSKQISLSQYLMNGLSNLDETYRKYSQAPTDDLIRFWRSKSLQSFEVMKAFTLALCIEVNFLVSSEPLSNSFFLTSAFQVNNN